MTAQSIANGLLLELRAGVQRLGSWDLAGGYIDDNCTTVTRREELRVIVATRFPSAAAQIAERTPAGVFWVAVVRGGGSIDVVQVGKPVLAPIRDRAPAVEVDVEVLDDGAVRARLERGEFQTLTGEARVDLAAVERLRRAMAGREATRRKQSRGRTRS